MQFNVKLDRRSIRELIASDTPLIDVRAPVEFAQGAVPQACNLPLLDDAQREHIGTVYQQDGREAAIELGLKLATLDVRQQRVERWAKWLDGREQPALYCFRGGMRSKFSQQWLQEAGIDVPIIEGGYKAIRHEMLAVLSELATAKLIAISGATGAGKTEVVHQVAAAIDLEGAANHRGSVYGGSAETQPSQVDFEHEVARQYLQRSNFNQIAMEDEGRLIGRVSVPNEVLAALKSSPMVIVESSLEERVARLFAQYVAETVEKDRNDPYGALRSFVQNGLDRIQKRLGGVRYDALSKLNINAAEALERADDPAGYHEFIQILLSDYYDPMYSYQRSKRASTVLFSGSVDAVADYLNQPS